MSNHLISLAYTRNLRTPMRKSVLVLMADKASDDGSGIWAAKQTMADELCCSKQTVIATIQGLIADGLVSECGQRKSPNGFTVEYGLNIAKIAALPLVKCHIDRSERLTGQPAGPVKGVDVTGQPAGPEPSLNHPLGESETREGAILALPQWSAFKAMRKQIKKPVNATAERRLLIKLLALEDDGYPPGEVLDQSTEHCWQGVFKIEEQDNGRTINRTNIRSMGGPRPDPTLAIVRAAIEAQRQGGGNYR